MKYIKKMFALICCFLSVSANAMTLEELYQKYDNIAVERVSQVSSVKIALYPNRGNEIAGQVLFSAGFEANKIELLLQDDSGNIYWQKSDKFLVSRNENKESVSFKYVLDSPLPKDVLLELKVKLFQDIDLVGMGSAQYENQSLQKNVIPTLSDIKSVLEDGTVRLSVVATVDGDQDLDGQVLVAQTFDSNNNLLFENVSQPQKLMAGKQSVYSVQFKAPKDSGTYKSEVFLRGPKKQNVSAKLNTVFLVDGVFAKLKKVFFPTPENEVFSVGETIKIASEGFVNKSLSSLNVEARFLSQKDELLYKDYFSVPVNRFREFLFEKQFLLESETGQIKAEIKIYDNGELVGTDLFESRVYKKNPVPVKKVVEEVVSERSTEDKVDSVNWGLVFSGVFFLVLALLIIWLLFVKKSKSKTMPSLFLLITGLGLFSSSALAADVNCAPSQVVVGGSNLHCRVLQDEVYSGKISAGDFAKIPFTSTAIKTVPNTSTLPVQVGEGLLVHGTSYAVDLAVCQDNTDLACVQVDQVLNVAAFTAVSDDWFRVYLDATKLGVPEGQNLLKKIKAVILRGGRVPIALEYAQPYGVNIDNSYPLVTFARFDSITNDELLENPTSDDYYNIDQNLNSFTNNEIRVVVTCDDGEASAGCMQDEYNNILVSGNFCDDSSVCKTTLPIPIRQYKICDKVGNCNELDLNIKNFDSSAPSFLSSSEAELRPTNPTGGTSVSSFGASSVGTIKTFKEFLFSLAGMTDNSNDNTFRYDSHACGFPVDKTGEAEDRKDGIVLSGSYCIEAKKACTNGPSFRGETLHGSSYCSFSCPGSPGSDTNQSGFVQVDCDTVQEDSNGKCCLPYKLICQYRFGFCFPVRFD